jgi:hypothetical protein
MKVNQAVKINHPLADSISIQDGEFHYCTPGVSSEIAFFKNRKWVTEVIPEFAEYSDGEVGDTSVYGWVPNEKINEFMERWG